MVPLVDKAGVLPAVPVPSPDPQRAPLFPRPAVDHFLYMLGNMVSVIGRKEVVFASNGVIMVRDLDLVRLLLAEQGWESTREHATGNPFFFTKRLRPYLTEEQRGAGVASAPCGHDRLGDRRVRHAGTGVPAPRATAGLADRGRMAGRLRDRLGRLLRAESRRLARPLV